MDIKSVQKLSDVKNSYKHINSYLQSEIIMLYLLNKVNYKFIVNMRIM